MKRFKAIINNRMEPLYDRVDAFERKHIIPLMSRIIRLFSDRIAKKIEPEKMDEGWKQRALDDFAMWLHELPEIPTQESGAMMESCDLYTLLSEFASLRQEIRMQTREQNRSLNIMDSVIEGYQQAVTHFQNASKRIENMEESIRTSVQKSSEKKMIIPFLDVRDALLRGKKASTELSKSSWLFKPKGIEDIAEGYEMAVRRFDKALAQVDVFPVETLEKPFNPRSMRAIDKRFVPSKAKGMVLEELVCGFVRGDEILRTAEVIVNGE